MKDQDLRRLYLAAWPFLLCATIVYSSIFTGGPQVPEPMKFSYVGKVGHFFVFGLIATLIYRVLAETCSRRVSFLLAVSITSLFGAADEWVQGFNPYRAMQFGDWVVDTAGALFAVTVYVCWPFYRNLMEYEITLFRRREKNHGGSCCRKTDTGSTQRDRTAR